MIDNGSLPPNLWHFGFPWGVVVRGCLPWPELLQAVRQFVPPAIPVGYEWNLSGYPFRAQQCHNMIMWLQTFAERPRDEIHRWGKLLVEEQRRAKDAELRLEDSDIYEARWRQWDEAYPECTGF
ncbi:hypothetical protein DFH06DRAFT_1317499 [Mycena polygramma]|nr:hypothetical protein DFH06DRAFT_1317499 [Mycena polygramma]